MKAKTVPSKWLESDGRRLDCGPYMSGALEAMEFVQRLPHQRLIDLTAGYQGGIYNGPQFRRNYVESSEHGVPFLTGGDLLQSDLSRLPLLSRKDAHSPKLRHLRLSPGMTIISCSGAIGRTAFVRTDMANIWSSQDVMKVVPNPAKIASGYLFAYLRSKFGGALVLSGTYGAIIQHIEAEHLAQLPVPRLHKDLERRIDAIVCQAAALLEEYQSDLHRATEAVFEGRAIWNPTPAEWVADRSDRAFVVKSSNLHSMRAWNHSQRADRIRSEIKSTSWARLGDLTDPSWLRWRRQFVRVDASPEFGVEVITQRPLFQLFPEGRWVSRNKLLGQDPRYLVPDQTTLIAKQGTLGEGELFCRCEFVTGRRMLDRAYSDHCMRIVAMPERVPPGYLFAFLRSEAAFRLLRGIAEGAKQQDLHWRTIAEIPIPRRDPAEESWISELIVSAYAKRIESVEKYLHAIELVELAIEGQL